MRRRIGLPFVLLLWAVVALGPVASPTRPSALAQAEPGTIAYVRPNDATGDEIWLIQPDGAHNRRIWSTGQPDPSRIHAISDLAWRPDSGEIAFASNHEAGCSVFTSDIYSVWPDGSGFRRVTNAPDCASLAQYPKGSVTVTIRNSTTRNPLFVYVQGAPGVQSIIVPQGGAGTVTFTEVADFGDFDQLAIAIWGLERWLAPIATADVKPGQTVHAGTINVTGAGIQSYGAYAPVWRQDGRQLGYIFGSCASMYQIPARPGAGWFGQAILDETGGYVFPCVMDWGPTPGAADQIVYYSYLNNGIFRVTEGSATAGAKLVDTLAYELVYDIQWLPDGSGFLYTKQTFDDNFVQHANIFLYTFAANTSIPLTRFTGEFVRHVSLSPDGQFIVFERSATAQFTQVDLWIMRREGGELRRLVENGRSPSWSQRAPENPHKVYLPLTQN